MTRMVMLTAWKLGLAALLLGTAARAQPPEACNFECTLKRHLHAIQTRDFDAFEATLTRGPRLSFILPNGKYVDDASAYREMLKGWFAEDGWTFNYQTISIEKSAGLGHALLLVSYDEADRDGKPYHLDHYLSLLFKREGEAWYLVHDQNTETTLAADAIPAVETAAENTEQTP